MRETKNQGGGVILFVLLAATITTVLGLYFLFTHIDFYATIHQRNASPETASLCHCHLSLTNQQALF